MSVSVIVRSKDEADRLRLTLLSLAAQTAKPEIIVVDDGSSDHTAMIIAEAAEQSPLRTLTHPHPKGRSHAANAGAELATGDILIFLDGDTLAAPDMVERHLDLHRNRAGLVGRGETFHLRCTRFFADPESGRPMPGEEARIARLSPSELARMRITAKDVLTNFPSIDARGGPGIYPGAGPRMLYELEMDALRRHPQCTVLWAAASGSNQSVPAAAFRAVGGFDEALTINEHRELGLRLCREGLKMAAAEGARTYHMTHRTGWRDPLLDPDWEMRFFNTHPLPEVALLSILWESLSDHSRVPDHAQIRSLPQLEDAAARSPGGPTPMSVRAAHLATVERSDVT